MDWTPSRVDLLVELWTSGLTASECGRALSCSRNAVIGKAHRLGLRHGKTDLQRKAPAKVSPAKRLRAIAMRISQRKAKPEPSPAQAAVDLVDLTASHCRWPLIGGDGITRYCGAPRLEPGPYCGWHARKAYTTTRHLTPQEQARRAAWMRQVRKRTARAVA